MNSSGPKQLLLAAGPAFVAGAALFPYHLATLQALNLAASLWLALFALAIAVSCFAIVAFQGRALLVGRAAPVAAATVTLATILVAAERPFGRAGLAALSSFVLVQAFLIVIFIVAAHSVLHATLGGPDRPTSKNLWIFVGCWLAVTLFAAIWLLSSKFIWYWDFSTYAILSRDLTEAIRESGFIVGGLGVVENSLKFEYNMAPALPMALIEVALGRTDRILLVLGIAFFYVGPTLLVGVLLLRRCARGALGDRMALFILAASALTFPVVFFSPLYGMPDIGGVGIAATIISVALSRKKSTEGTSVFADAPPMIACGGLLVLLCMFRRWYIFLTPSIFIILAVNEFRRLDGPMSVSKRLVATVKPLALLASFSVLCGFAFYWDRLLVMASKNYAGDYRAWVYPVQVEIAECIDRLGYGPLALYFACALYLTAHRATRLAGLAVFFTPALVVAMFKQVQSFDIHHYLLLFPCMIFAVALAVAHAIAARPQMRGLILTALALCAAASLFGVFSPGADTLVRRARIVPTIDMTPPRRDDLKEIDRLTRDLARHTDAGEKICVVASSKILNRTTIRENAFILAPETQSLISEKFIWLGDVDRRDGFLPEIASCDYAVLTNPRLTHFAIQEQQLIVYLDRAIKSGVGIGAEFRVTDQTYHLIEGVEARIYRRIGAISEEDLRAYFNAVTSKPAS